MNTIYIDKQRCKGCDICAAFCPKEVLKLKEGLMTVEKQEACIACRMCVKLCPDYAINVVKEGETS